MYVSNVSCVHAWVWYESGSPVVWESTRRIDQKGRKPSRGKLLTSNFGQH